MGRLLKYDQARLAVLNIIAEDGLRPGDRLAPERSLVSRVDCSIITLRKALLMLEQEGILERTVGSGTFLMQSVANLDSRKKILFLNVGAPNEFSAFPHWAWEYMRSYFDRHGLDFRCLQVGEFSDTLVNETRDALGIMLFGCSSPDFMSCVKSLKMPMVVVGNTPPFKGVPQVEHDMRLCAEAVTEELIRDGARKIAFFNAAPDYYPSQALEAGFRQAMNQHGLPVGAKDVLLLEVSTRAQEIDRLIPQYTSYDALLLEVGVYYSFLAATRANHWNFRQKLGVLPLTDDFIDIGQRRLFRPSPDTMFGHFYQSIFKIASEMLLEHILRNKTMSSLSVTP